MKCPCSILLFFALGSVHTSVNAQSVLPERVETAAVLRFLQERPDYQSFFFLAEGLSETTAYCDDVDALDAFRTFGKVTSEATPKLAVQNNALAEHTAEVTLQVRPLTAVLPVGLTESDAAQVFLDLEQHISELEVGINGLTEDEAATTLKELDELLAQRAAVRSPP